ncbi:ATP-grasp fold amidoligase family protein [Pseudomonas sp. JV414]|uniref:ATP-grasp fold amidoligase family protein n=1 Tax=Pseudomonas sp. JV414 TaxID=1733110 RepID=UPI0028F44011|nr:ATP-grasp fold amidoligase family protein [Pseudomonas sp. JV414]
MILSRKSQLWTISDALHPPSICESERLKSTDSDDQWQCCNFWQRKLSNKLNAKEFASKFGVRVAKLYWEGGNASDIPFANFPDTYVIKTSNGTASREVVPVRRGWDVLRNQSASSELVRTFYSELLSSSEFRGTPILVEEFIEPSRGEVLPRDYKVYCFGGQPHYIEVINRAVKRDAWYSIDWARIPDRMQRCFEPDLSIARPVLLEDLLFASRRLSEAYQYPFVRLDFYLTSDKVIFGEFTHTPFAGKSIDLFTPFAELILGKLWSECLAAAPLLKANDGSSGAS